MVVRIWTNSSWQSIDVSWFWNLFFILFTIIHAITIFYFFVLKTRVEKKGVLSIHDICQKRKSRKEGCSTFIWLLYIIHDCCFFVKLKSISLRRNTIKYVLLIYGKCLSFKRRLIVQIHMLKKDDRVMLK